MVEMELELCRSKSGEIALPVQNVRLHEYPKNADEFRQYLERRNGAKFGSVSQQFNQPTNDKERDLVSVKTLCDMRDLP